MKAHLCTPDQIYQTPPGYWDQCYTYAYDTDALADGVDFQHLGVGIQGGCQFIMRKVDGARNVVNPATGRIWLRDNAGQPVSDHPLFADYYRSAAVVPERAYDPAGLIDFDLYTTLRASNVVGPNTTYLSQLAFRGIHRRPGREPLETQYNYREVPFTYTAPLTVTWLATGTTPTVRGSVQIMNADFELYLIRVFVRNTGVTPGPGVLLKMRLFDALERSLSNVPLLMDYWMENSHLYLGNCFSPPVLYPIGSEIRADIQSLALAGQVPLNYEMEFIGVRRMRA